MEVLIIYHSEHHQNTEKIARVMAAKIGADLKDAKEVRAEDINNYEIIGFGSGVYNGRFHKDLLEIIDNIPHQDNKKAFIFSTTGSLSYSRLAHDRFRPLLLDKGFKIIGEFSFIRLDTFLISPYLKSVLI